MSSRSSMPAFKAQKSKRPLDQVKAFSKAAACEDQEDTSVCRKRVEGPRSEGGGLMSQVITRQDLVRRCFVSARPMPEEAPVMRATGLVIVRLGWFWGRS